MKLPAGALRPTKSAGPGEGSQVGYKAHRKPHKGLHATVKQMSGSGQTHHHPEEAGGEASPGAATPERDHEETMGEVAGPFSETPSDFPEYASNLVQFLQFPGNASPRTPDIRG